MQLDSIAALGRRSRELSVGSSTWPSESLWGDSATSMWESDAVAGDAHAIDLFGAVAAVASGEVGACVIPAMAKNIAM
jgi:hypothetical protein